MGGFKEFDGLGFGLRVGDDKGEGLNDNDGDLAEDIDGDDGDDDGDDDARSDNGEVDSGNPVPLTYNNCYNFTQQQCALNAPTASRERPFSCQKMRVGEVAEAALILWLTCTTASLVPC